MMFRSWEVQVVVSALFLGVVFGALATAALFKWKERSAVLRVMTVMGGLAVVFWVLVAMMVAEWNPD